MTDFLATKHTIDAGKGISTYGAEHLIWLLCGAAAIIILCRLYRRADERGRGRLRALVCALVLIDEAVKYFVTIPTGQWRWEFLPLHLCSLSVFMILIHALTRSQRVAEALFAISLPSALMALVFPNWMMLPCWNWESIHSFSIHILIVAYPCMLLSGGFIPDFRRLKYSFLPLAAAIAAAIIANRLLDTNFFFLNGGDEGNPLSFLEKRVGMWYVLALPVAAAVVWTIMYTLASAVRKRSR